MAVANSSSDTRRLPPTEASSVLREERRIKNRRDRCAFEKTQALIAKMLERGGPDDLPWVSYVFGRVHLARAAALADIDRIRPRL